LIIVFVSSKFILRFYNITRLIFIILGQILAGTVRDSEQLSAGNSMVRWWLGGPGHILE